MKIHGTAKGGALSTKDFGVAFGGAAPADSCDLFDESTASGNEGLDQDLVGFRSNITTASVSKLTMNMFKQEDGTPPDHIINLKHYESSDIQETYAPVGNVTTTEIAEATEAAGVPNTKVEWLISPSISLTTNSRLVIDDTGSGINRLKGLTRNYDAGLSLSTTYSTNNGSSWTESTGYLWLGCLSS